VSLRRFGALGVAGLAVLGALSGRAEAQGLRLPPGFIRPYPSIPYGAMAQAARVNPNFLIAPGMNIRQFGSNIATLGQAYSTVPPYLLGYPYPYPPSYGFPPTPAVQYGSPYYPFGGYGGYGLSTFGGYGGGYGLSTGGYGLSTGGYGGYGVDPYAGGYMRGEADVLAASGKYLTNLQQARILREEARQKAIETRRKLFQEALDYERNRPTALDMRRNELKTGLESARHDPPATDILSGRALNALLRSIRTPGKALNRGPTIDLDEDNLKNINVTDAASRGNAGLLKQGELRWPLPLRESDYDEARKDLNKKLMLAVAQVKDKDPVDRSTLKDLYADLKALNDKLSANVGEMSPSQYIEARRYLNQLADAVRVLEDPNAAKYFNNTWSAKGRTVAELVENMAGLKFAPAVPGQEKEYHDLYQKLRQFEHGLQLTASR
jgi:hypothetical protein